MGDGNGDEARIVMRETVTVEKLTGRHFRESSEK